jgi:LAO/AO transport system kinase
MQENGEFAERRKRQAVEWMRDMLSDRLLHAVKANPDVAARLPAIEAGVRDGRLFPTRAVDEILDLMGLKA